MDEKEKSAAATAEDNTTKADPAAAEQATTTPDEQAKPGDTPPDETAKQDNESEKPDEGAPDGVDDAADGEKHATDMDGDTDNTPADMVVNPESDLNAKVGWLTTQLMTAKATAAATALGIPPEKAKYALRLADLSQIDVTAEDADKRIGAAMGQVVKDLPELAARQQQTTGTPGMFARQSGGTQLTPFERGLRGN